MSSRMTCTSLERLAPLPSVPPRPPAPPVPGPLPFRDERRAAARSSVVPRKLHIISTPAISVPFPSCSLAPSALPPPAAPGWLCALSNWYNHHRNVLLATTAAQRTGKPNGKRNAGTENSSSSMPVFSLRVLILSSRDDLRHEHNGRQAMRKNATVALSSLLLAISSRAITNISVSQFFYKEAR